jgi:hypothetical protein
MVERIEKKFNKGICKVQTTPLFWIKEIRTSRWDCHKCRRNNGPGSIAFETTVRYATSQRKNDGEMGWFEKPIKHYLCLECAIEILDEAKEKVLLVKENGIEAFKLLESL